MKYISIVSLLLACVLMTSCIYDEDPQEQPGMPKQVRIDIRTAASRQPTKAISALSENHVRDLYMLVYDADGNYLKYKKASSIINKDTYGQTKTASFELEPEEILENVRLRFYANVEENVSNLSSLLGALAPTSVIDDFDPLFEASLPWNASSDDSFRAMPMYGGTINAGRERVDTPITLVEGTNPTVSVMLLRATARINVVLEDEVLTVASVDVFNTLSAGHVMTPNLSSSFVATAPYTDGLSVTDTQLHFEALSPVHSFMNAIYVAETSFNAEHPVFLVIGVSDGEQVKYSRVDLLDDDGNYLDVLRNFSYQFNIRFKPSGVLAGYETIEQAVAHKTENMESSIQYVNDTYQDVIVTDGYYTLCMNRDEFQLPLEGGKLDFVVYSNVPSIEGSFAWRIDTDNIRVNGIQVSDFTDLQVYKRDDPSEPTFSGTENYNYYLTIELPLTLESRIVAFDIIATEIVRWTVTVYQG